jgi:hypothetical protein
MLKSEVLILEDSPIRNLRMRLTQSTEKGADVLKIYVYNHYQDELPQTISVIWFISSSRRVQFITDMTDLNNQVTKRQYIVALPDDEDGILDYGILRSRIRVGQPYPRPFRAFLERREWTKP